ncbi:Membrane-bound O-acyltransferase domain-containing protein 2 [Cricetulus griseus]|uniref:Membrane-bound O-acyltransferase domain-containing protein 2 n=1 Tax=Cricetulus griseus TaxID=10029 RepID=G3HM38_CRIGR|nr:Membrane-bound O-acyltransferase domain-containing protein 2 [Cricetulus griseus]ERE68400.1 membrane-bound O-acyltransferase domain-containing protein 2 [Cricetulus griseus]
MMIITQKITSLAFEIHDGMFRKDEELTPSQRGLAVRKEFEDGEFDTVERPLCVRERDTAGGEVATLALEKGTFEMEGSRCAVQHEV